jgi:phytoene synthase
MLSLEEGYKRAEQITKAYAKTFYFASHFLPRKERPAAYAVYAFCRISDETVDSELNSNIEENLRSLETQLKEVYAQAHLKDDLLLAFRDTVEQYHIPKDYFDELLAGMRMDLRNKAYEHFYELYKYCYRVAGVVGLMMLKILSPRKSGAEKYAESLGIAMQLTNILRDIKEDYQRGRIYLPADELRRFKVSEEDLLQEKADDNFKQLMKFQIERARKYYKESIPGIKMLKGFRSRLVVCCMKNIYSRILHVIERNKYDVFKQRARVGLAEKIWITLKTLFKGEYL